MKKIKIVALIILSLILSTSILVACNNGGGTTQENKPGDKEYTITITASQDYSIKADKEKATQGTVVNLTVDVTNSDKLLENVKFNDYNCTKTDTGYKFTMPAENVTLTAILTTLTEVKIDGMATFLEDNMTTITQNGTYNTETVLDKNKWGLDVSFSTNSMTRLLYDITSSNQSVIPNDSISLIKKTNNNTGLIDQAKIYIDTTKINVGTTWLIMDFINDNLSGSSKREARLIVKITVVASEN